MESGSVQRKIFRETFKLNGVKEAAVMDSVPDNLVISESCFSTAIFPAFSSTTLRNISNRESAHIAGRFGTLMAGMETEWRHLFPFSF